MENENTTQRDATNAAIAQLHAMVNDGEEWDTCDVADAIVDVMGACGLNIDNNIQGLILGVPGDYSDLLAGIHYPDEEREEHWQRLAPALSDARAYLTNAEWDGAREAINAIDMLNAALVPNLSYINRVGMMLACVRDAARWWAGPSRGLPSHIAEMARVISDGLGNNEFAIPLTPAHTD